MRFLGLAILLSISAAPAFAETPTAAPAATAAAKYTTADTEIGTLLDDPAAKAIVEKHIPGMTTNDQVDMARGMTLKAVQQYSPDEVTDARLAAIDAEFAKLPK
jgi:para-nitrobenzyl esterase